MSSENKETGPVPGPRVIVALDYAGAEPALAIAKRLDPSQCRLKAGKELFTAAGPQLIENLQALGFDVFLDLKYHDIPNTVAKACEAAANLGVWMVNVHATVGRRMMEAAVEAVKSSSHQPLLIAVTVLTSMDAKDLQEIGISGTAEKNVLALARLAQQAGMDGVVCSPREVGALQQQCGSEFTLVTPGVRPAGSTADDQKRIMTPSEAITAGSSYLVIGRPITQADDPLAALQAINIEIDAVLRV